MPSEVSPATLRRWRQHLANERAEAAVYRDLAERRTGEEREILLALAEAERRHEQHWLDLLGDEAGVPVKGDLRTRVLGWLGRRFGSVFVLALAQSAESRSPYRDDPDATLTMAADEQIHEEVVRGLAARGRARLSGTFRAAVFGASDGLVSNLALVLGMAATGVDARLVLIAGVAGLLAGALSMGAGEYISVSSQRELLDASVSPADSGSTLALLDVDENELALVYRARGMAPEEAEERAAAVLGGVAAGESPTGPVATGPEEGNEVVGTGLRAAFSSFLFFAAGAVIPVIPYATGLSGLVAVVIAAVLVGIALLATGAVVGVLSGASPWSRALRKLAIGYGAAAVTYLLGLAFGPLLG